MIRGANLQEEKRLQKMAWYISSWPGPVVHLILIPLLSLGAFTASFLFAIPLPLVFLGIIFCMLISAGLLLHLAQKLHFRTQELDKHLLQSRNMAAIGQISSGIAHELNTPLNIIVQELELMRLALKGQDEATRQKEIIDSINQIEIQVQRCTEVTHGMLNFARDLHTVEQKTDINRLIEDMVVWVERESEKNGIKIVREYSSDLPELTTDAPMLRHLVLNLLNNARQAIKKNGKIKVITAHEGKILVVRVEDNGPGIPPEHLESIFTPFFTTKAPGKGTGLGLPFCLAIVTRLGGTIQAGNREQGGAIFQVRLPYREEGKTSLE